MKSKTKHVKRQPVFLDFDYFPTITAVVGIVLIIDMSELRQRGVSGISTMQEETESIVREQGSGLSAKALVDSSPQHHGVALKLHIPFFYNLLPVCIQRIMLLIGINPTWRQRYLILCGSFLYKFKDQTSKTPKGSPFEVQTVTVKIATAEETREIASLPPGFSTIFTLSTLSRKHYYAVRDREEAMLWIRSLAEAKQELITRKMGHSKVPYPKSWTYFDSLGGSLVKSKERIKKRMEHSRLQEMEMSNFTDGGPLPRGYYG